MHRIMICEDDPKLAGLLKDAIEKYGFQAHVVKDFDRVADFFQQCEPHLVLLDVNLPRYDGFYWCRQIRSLSTCPIMFISARDGEMDQVMALEYGADDYITKPFHYEVVMAKIRSHLRRVYGEYAPQSEERIVQLAGLILYPERMEMQLHQFSVQLSKNETILIEAMLKSHPKLAPREMLLEKLWDDQTFVDENTLNVNMTRVRKKLQELGIEDAIETVRGAGYRLQTTWDAKPT
ncbi:response regulator transcription factor [Paenibacillus tarimensis]|uniref:response regulator transcription factor n=1 Tax=Paenibacillus tarimensis TaxID=416012 RepID=UPI001F2EB960|nr:response regulator transcription factor [Paenibacillus tarimensis]MCF2944326.1 response regulator transcription factor [Paenibacillus tarimensis]